MEDKWINDRNKIIGLGENSHRKSYYPELQNKIEELEVSRKNMDIILNSTSDGIIIHDILGNILFLNKPAELLLNAELGDNLTVMDISAAQNNIDSLPDIWDKVRNDNPQTIEWIVLQNKTKKEIPVQVSINNTFWMGLHVFVAVIRDFTVRKEYEEMLLEAKKKAEESDHLKTAFLQNMSHEIRTPMNSIVGFSELLSDSDLLPEKRKKFTSIIVNSANQLLSIVNDILTISTLQTKQDKVYLESININQVLSDLLIIYEKQAFSRHLSIQLCRALSDKESVVFTDKTKIIQILTNLLNNAFKFIHEGSIEFGYRLIDADMVFYVTDSGIGISEEMQTIIFERFMQASDFVMSNYGGNGLGLAISKEFVDLLGGKIWVESDVNKGSTFYFSIKYLPVNKEQ